MKLSFAWEKIATELGKYEKHSTNIMISPFTERYLPVKIIISIHNRISFLLNITRETQNLQSCKHTEEWLVLNQVFYDHCSIGLLEYYFIEVLYLWKYFPPI